MNKRERFEIYKTFPKYFNNFRIRILRKFPLFWLSSKQTKMVCLLLLLLFYFFVKYSYCILYLKEFRNEKKKILPSYYSGREKNGLFNLNKFFPVVLQTFKITPRWSKPAGAVRYEISKLNSLPYRKYNLLCIYI